MKPCIIYKTGLTLFVYLMLNICFSCETGVIKNGIGYKMVLVKPGTFQMGCNFGKNYEKPVHEVTITKPYYIGLNEVTYNDYEIYCKETGRKMPKKFDWTREDSPIVYINWFEAVEYCNWLSKEEGLQPCYTINGDDVVCDFNIDGYRLPTEAEWDWAAQGEHKSKGYKYSGSNNPVKSGWNMDDPWFIDKNGKKTHVVGKKCPNEIGLYDMSGSVWEWCWDWRGDYLPEPQTDPKGPYTGETRILRGGSWDDYITCMRVTNRYSCNPRHGFLPIGFRYVRIKKEN